MSNFISDCFWTYNCGARDYDIFATWENLTIQRNYLRYVKITLNFYTQLDGWLQKSKTFTPPNAPTSDPFTFYAQLSHSWCKGIPNCNQTYFGKKYRFNTCLFILSGGVGQYDLLDEEYIFNSDSVSTNLKFCKTDPFYNETHPSCTAELPNC